MVRKELQRKKLRERAGKRAFEKRLGQGRGAVSKEMLERNERKQ